MSDLTDKRPYQAPRLVVHGSIAGLTGQTPTPTPVPSPTPTMTITPTPTGPSVINGTFEDLGPTDLGTAL
jgi:hypothetical protein